jgi:hypothetical protein
MCCHGVGGWCGACVWCVVCDVVCGVVCGVWCVVCGVVWCGVVLCLQGGYDDINVGVTMDDYLMQNAFSVSMRIVSHQSKKFLFAVS